jgi:hypothetical protein
MPTPAEIASALSDPERLRVFARIVLAGELPAGADPAAAKHVKRLTRAGLVGAGPDGPVARPEVFREALAGLHTPPAADGITGGDPELAAFFPDGRLTGMPAKAAVREKVLRRIAEHVFEPAVTYTEPQVNARLDAVHADHSMLRRYLVDHGLLTRSPDGRAYHRAG